MKMTLHIDDALLARVMTAAGTTSKTKAVDLAGSPAKPVRLWTTGVVLVGYAAFVALLVLAERIWGEDLPVLEKNWFYLAIGPGIAVVFWVAMTLKRWNSFRRSGLGKTEGAVGSGNPVGSGAPQVQQGMGGQRQRAGSA